MKIAIQGHPTRGKEVIQILKSLGATSYCTHDTCSHPEWYWYINKNREITCNPKGSMYGYKLYTLEEFEKAFPFRIGDRVISKTTDFIGTIIKLKESGCYYVKYDNGNLACTFGQNLKLYTEMKEERNITLTIDKAKEWYKKGGDLKEVALQAFKEEELNPPLPRSWEEFCKNNPIKTSEAVICTESTIVTCDYSGIRDSDCDREICPSRKSAEAHLAMIQLEQLRNYWRQGWKPDWNDDQQTKYCVVYDREEFKINILYETRLFLSFPTKEMAEEFLKCFRDLIEKAGDLI